MSQSKLNHALDTLSTVNSKTSDLGNGQPKPEGTWDWYGHFDPRHRPGRSHGPNTFSIGVFRWRKTASGKPVKGASLKRFSAPVHAPEEAYRKALAYIETRKQEAQSQQIARMELDKMLSDKPGWIPVHDRLPAPEERVLFCGLKTDIYQLGYYQPVRGCWSSGGSTYSTKDITHWMPKPAWPEES